MSDVKTTSKQSAFDHLIVGLCRAVGVAPRRHNLRS